LFRILVSGDEESRRYLHPGTHSWQGSAAQLLAAPLHFPYLIYGGRYRIGATSCGPVEDCQLASMVFSDYINLQPEVFSHCDQSGVAANSSLIEVDSPVVEGLTVLFRFAFSPCSPLLPYDAANVTLYSSVRREECGTGAASILQERQPLDKSTNDGHAIIVYQTPELEVRNLHHCTVYN
jgi:hypothetical protein